MASGRCERKKRNLGSLDLLSFSCLGTEIFGSHLLDLWVTVAGMRGGKRSNDSCWWSVRLKEFFSISSQSGTCKVVSVSLFGLWVTVAKIRGKSEQRCGGRYRWFVEGSMDERGVNGRI